MFRYAFVLIAALGAAAAIAQAPAGTPQPDARPAAANQTIIEKNSAFPVIGPQSWVACATEDCSDVPNQ